MSRTSRMFTRSSALRATLFLTFVCALMMTALAAGIERVGIVNVDLPYSGISPFRVYATAGLNNGTASGSAKIGPPAWDGTVKYFSGSVTTAEKLSKGFRLLVDGTYGDSVSRKQADARIVVDNGKVSAFVWSDEGTEQQVIYDTKGLVVPKSGSITLYNANNVPVTTPAD